MLNNHVAPEDKGADDVHFFQVPSMMKYCAMS